MEYKELTEKVIGCAYRVYNQMGFGFLESVYEKCIFIELKKAGLKAEEQTKIQVFYDLVYRLKNNLNNCVIARNEIPRYRSGQATQSLCIAMS